MSNTLTMYLKFFRAGLLNHEQTGGIVPSQRFLVAKMIAPIPKGYNGQILELGAGNGALTRRLADRCPRARILACEINPILAQDNRDYLKTAGHNGRVEVIATSAENLLAEVGAGSLEKPEFVVSGIPLRNLGDEKACALLDSISQTLRAGGMYIQFQYSMLDRGKIKARFPNTRTVPAFLNFPPAFVYYAQR